MLASSCFSRKVSERDGNSAATAFGVNFLLFFTVNQGFFAILGRALRPFGLGKLALQAHKLGNLL